MAQGEWEPEAENWVRWARTPSHDAYWYYREEFFDRIVPPPGRRTLEIGCGEGRVARDLAARGHRLTAVDTAYTLVRHARDAGQAGAYALGDGAQLPFPSRCFDIVVAYNVLQVVADMPRTVEEAGRVVRPGGYLCACIAHPVTDLGRFVGTEPDTAFTLRSPYFESVRVEETVERDGLSVTLRGWTYTLEDYASTLAHAGFVIETIAEPRPAPPADRYARWSRIPMFMTLRAVKR